ncbi:YMGG-like glycine zipper-containing protein [Chryseobacterium sp. G0201]|uniref:YMGG-like glycine zipper-containing protein n=1 Tax=Chryseobacterium sp. G0201 TaxID=2487065 RepID=UPI000F4FE68E|nr:YMGG-like glycine zipper-containing protein [Chryseobacterium sp. G0201]AZA52065.1 glycine zipper 2TM domain-containing protein [Chryseobacterium sp. G0201]
MKNIVLTGLLSVFLLTACKKDDQVAEKSLEQQKIEFQSKQLEIEKQKLAIEKEKMAYEAQKKADSIVEVQKAKTAANNSKPQVIRETKTIYRDRESNSSSNNGTYADNGNSSTGTTATKKKGMSKAAKGTIIGTVGGAAAGAIIAKKNRGLGAVIGGVVGGATGYTIGRAGDRKDGRVQPK